MEKFIKHVNIWIVLLIAVLIAQTLVIAILTSRVNTLWTQVNTPEPGREMTFETSQQIHNAISSIYKQPSIDAPANRVYFPDLKIYLPYNEQSGRVVYDYVPAYDNVPSQITLNATPAVNYIPLSFNDIPCLQGMVDININKSFGSSSTASVKLEDGRTLYMKAHPSKENLTHCNDAWGDFGPTQMINLFKQVKSY